MNTFLKKGWWMAAVVLLLAGNVKAATAYSHVRPLSQYTTSSVVRVEYDASASAGAVARVDLYASKDGAAFGAPVQTVYTPTQSFYYDTASLGDGVYSFYTVATLSTSETETKSTAEAYTTVDTHAPAAPKNLSVNQTTDLTTTEVIGAAGAVEGNAKVYMYTDAAATTLLRSTTAQADGSFGPMEIGPTSVSPVWLVAVDAAGNRSAATQVVNTTSYVGALTQFSVKADSDTSLLVSFVAPLSAKQFRVQYRHAGGAVWSVDYYTIGENGTTIRLTGLESGRAYDVRVAPVDSNLNVGQWSMQAARTTGAKVDSVVLPGEKGAVTAGTTTGTTSTVKTVATPSSTTTSTATATTSSTATKSTSTATTTPTTTETAKPVAATTPTDTNTATTGTTDTNAATTSNTNDQNTATPWVILAILIVLAGIATGGYFYWFSGPEEITTVVTTPGDEKETEVEKKAEEDEADKRW